MSSKSNLGHFFFFHRPMLQAVMWLFFSVDLRVFRSFLVLSMATKRSAVLTVVIQMARYNYEIFCFCTGDLYGSKFTINFVGIFY